MPDVFAQSWNLFFGHARGVDGVVQVHGDGRGPEHPVAGAVVLDGADDTDRHDGNFQLLGDAESAVLKFIDAAVASALRFRKNDEAGAAIDGVAGKSPHASEIGRTTDIGHGNVTESFHQPAINWNVEMRFELPTTHKLRDGAIQREGIEKIYMIGDEETGFLRVEPGRADYFNFSPRKKYDAAAEGALQPIVLFGIEKNGKYDQDRDGDSAMQKADGPKKCATQNEPVALSL